MSRDYAVIDGESSEGYFKETRGYRLSMARIAASMYEPLVDVANVGDGQPMFGEEVAFRLFDLNSGLKFTLVYLSSAVERIDRADTIERLVTNMGMRLCGFDPNMHRVVALFNAGEREDSYEVKGSARQYVDEGLFGVQYLNGKELGLPEGRSADEIVLRALRDKDNVECVLLSRNVAQYIAEHHQYRRRLVAHLSTKLGQEC